MPQILPSRKDEKSQAHKDEDPKEDSAQKDGFSAEPIGEIAAQKLPQRSGKGGQEHDRAHQAHGKASFLGEVKGKERQGQRETRGGDELGQSQRPNRAVKAPKEIPHGITNLKP
jgi:hypothetical protein